MSNNASDRTNQINENIYSRNIPSQPLQPSFSSTPQSTKYSYMTILESPNKSNVALNNYNTYSPEGTFYGGNSKAPWSGFSSQIDTETSLRNQIYALQNNTQSTYIPPSQSNLYNYKWKNKNNYSVEETSFFKNSDLFSSPQFSSFNPNLHSQEVGYAMFNNATRQQTKNIMP